VTGDEEVGKLVVDREAKINVQYHQHIIAIFAANHRHTLYTVVAIQSIFTLTTIAPLTT
jgi:hypothetical protein